MSGKPYTLFFVLLKKALDLEGIRDFLVKLI